MAAVRLYAHSLTLAAWAFAVWALRLQSTPGVVAAILATLAVTAVIAERERARRRRGGRT